MNAKRSSHRLVLLGQYAIAIAGGFLKSVEMYSLHDDYWTNLSDLNEKRSGFTASTIKDKYIYVFAGINENKKLLDSIE